MWKAGQAGHQMTTERIRISRWVIKATNTIWICNNNCFSTAKMVARTCFNIRYTYIACLVKCCYDRAQVWKKAVTITKWLQCLKYSCKRDKSVCIRRLTSPDWRSRLRIQAWWVTGELFSVLKRISPWEIWCSDVRSAGTSCLHVYYAVSLGLWFLTLEG